MKKKYLLIIATGLLFIASLAGAYFLGSSARERQLVYAVNNDDVPLAQAVQIVEQGSDQIAVVNLDLGVELANGEHIFYSDHAIRLPTSNFRFTSLNEARVGLGENHFGALIVIPSDFSKNVESLNAIPTQIILEYEISQLLSGEEQRDILYTVLHFGDSLNTDLSYMYLSNILAEFHQAQDDSLLVLRNDKRIAEAIRSIHSNDLLEMIRFPEVARDESWIESLDIFNYMGLSEQLLQELGNDYQEKVQLNSEQLTLLTEHGETAIRGIDELARRVYDIDFLYDLNRDRIYSEGRRAVSDRLNDFNLNNLGANRDGMVSVVDQASTQVQYIESRLRQSIEQHYLHLTNIQLIPSTHPILRLWWQEETNQYILGGSLGDHQVTINPISTPLSNDEKDSNLHSLQEIIEMLLENYDQPVSYVLEAANYFITDGFDTAHDFLVSIQQGNTPLETHRCSITTNGDVSDISDEMFGLFIAEMEERLDSENFRFEAFYFDDNDEPQYYDEFYYDDEQEDERKTIFTLFSTYESYLEDVRSRLDNFESLDVASVQDIIDEQIIHSVVTRSGAVQGEVTTGKKESTDLLHTHQQQLRGFAPVSDDGFITHATGQLFSTMSDMYAHLLENNQAHIEQNRNLRDETMENIDNIRDTVIEAEIESHLRVEEGLEHAQTLNSTLSEQNHNMLNDFAQRLPFTRLGTVEFTTAYEFIVRPMLLHQIGEYITVTGNDMNDLATTMTSNIVVGLDHIDLNQAWIWLIPPVVVGMLICTVVLWLSERNKRKKEDF